MGAFIVFEGGDGSGKGTQVRILKNRLSREGYPVISAYEPGGTALGEAARRWLKKRADLTPLAELLLFEAARAQLVENVITPALASHQVVVCDRFYASTVAYQGYGRGLDLELVQNLNQVAARGVRPDLTVLLDIPPEIGLARKRGVRKDSFEAEAIEFHQRVREGYRAQASQDADSWFVLDGMQERRVLSAQIWKRVQPLLVDQ